MSPWLTFKLQISKVMSHHKDLPNSALFFAAVQENAPGAFLVDLHGFHVRSVDKLPLAAHLFRSLAQELPHVAEIQTINTMCLDLLGDAEPLQ